MSIVSNSLKRIKPSPTIAVTSKAREMRAAGKDVIGLGAGEPDFDTPDNIKEAAIEAIRKGDTKYTAVDGTPALKKAIQAKFSRENDLSYELDQISVGTGGKQVLYNAFMATINKGDEVIIPAPYWVSYPDIVLLAGGKPKIIKCDEKNNFKLTPEKLKKVVSKKTKWIIINSPSNPTGSGYTKDEIIALSKILMKYKNLYILSDDIYEHITYDGFKFFTIAQIEKLKSRTLTMNGVSKSYSMTGWRIGYAGGPEFLIKSMAKIQSQSTSNPTSICQYAALEALTSSNSFLTENNAVFYRRRNLILDLINKSKGLECNVPNGAFYIFPSCEKLIGLRTQEGKIINNSSDFSKYLLEEVGVAVVPGIAFGMENFFRISYATSDDILKEAGSRIHDACSLLN